MKIRTKLSLITSLAIISASVMIASAYFSIQTVESSIHKEQIATKLIKGFGELLILTNEYAATCHQRALKQRNLQYQSLVKLSNAHSFNHPEKQYLLNQVKVRLTAISILFDDLYQHLNQSADKTTPQYTEIKTALVERLTIETQAAADDAFKISSLTRQEITSSSKKTNRLIMLLAVTISLIIIGISVLLRRSIIKPINDLHREIERVQAGSLTQPLDVDSNDELGMLARSFNQMSSTLHATTISRDELEDHVKQRTLELNHAKNLAEKASAAKSEFLSRMSHELRTPMNAILGFSQLLAADSSLNREQKESVQEVLNAGYHLLELINEVLDLAKIEAGKIEIHPEHIDVEPFINDCLQLVASMAENKHITIFYKPLKLSLFADRFRLKQIMLNLLTNAIKYNRDAGEIHIQVIQHDSTTRIEIHDTGHGIPPEKADLIFKAFERLGMDEMKVDGTGIGLTISKQLTELMHGSIGFTSAPGVGTTFWLEFPADPY